MKNVSVLFPYKSDNGPRDVIYKWVRRFYEENMPEAEICIGEGECQSNQFSRSKAVNNAAKQATRDIFVIADTDIFYCPQIISKAIKQLDTHPWVIPFEKKHYIKKESTNLLLSEPPQWPLNIEIEVHTPDKKKKGGLNIVPRENFEKVKGFDERFCGWGGEDSAFFYTLNAMCGQYARLDAEIYHMWHASGTNSISKNPYYQENRSLNRRYRHALKSKDKQEMQKLIDERFFKF